MTALLEKARGLLQGEPLRAIVYGAAVVVWLVTRIAQALHIGNFQVVNLDDALLVATAAATALTELVRRYVYSPATVAAIVNAPPTAAGPIAAAEAVGVDTSQPIPVINEEGLG